MDRESLKNAVSNATSFLKEVFDKYNLHLLKGSLIVDDETEFKGSFDDFLKQPQDINSPYYKKLIAQKDIIESNSKIEALNKIMKYQFLRFKAYANFAQLEEYLKIAILEYHDKPKAFLHGETPQLVLEGTKPDKHKFTNQIIDAKKKHIIANQNITYCAKKTVFIGRLILK
jgi:putative transposase